MRIALLHNLPSGGGKRALYEWSRRLAARHELVVYTLNSANHEFCDIRPFVQQHNVFEFSPHRLFKKRPWGRLNPMQRWRDLGDLEFLGRRMADRIAQDGCAVVFAHTCLYTFIPVALGFVRTPAIYYLHEPFGPTFDRHIQRPYTAIKKWAEVSRRIDPLIALHDRRLEHVRVRSIRQTTRLLANSEFTREQMRLAYGVDAPVCHLGVDASDFRPMPDVPKQDSVLSVGELSPRKGFDFLIESLACIPPDKRPALRLACNRELVQERRYLSSLAARRGVDLTILSRLSTEELALEYNRARICVYAPVMEPLGFVPLESMACGTPVLGVAEGGVLETIRHGETGLLTERDSQQFADAITKLLADPALTDRLGKQGPPYVRGQWSWDDAVDRLEAHLTDVAARGSRPDSLLERQ